MGFYFILVMLVVLLVELLPLLFEVQVEKLVKSVSLFRFLDEITEETRSIARQGDSTVRSLLQEFFVLCKVIHLNNKYNTNSWRLMYINEFILI